jgi:hypothetical protein
MANVLLIVPHFWDPVCVPLGITSLKAYVEPFGHAVTLLDLRKSLSEFTSPGSGAESFFSVL